MLGKKSLVAAFIVLGGIAMWAVRVPEAEGKPGAPANSAEASAKAGAISAYGRLPLSFIENQGQVDSPAKFYTTGPGFQVCFTPQEITLYAGAARNADMTLEGQGPKDFAVASTAAPVPPQIVRWRPVNLSPGVKIAGEELLPGKVNYYRGNDPRQWRPEVPTYGAVVYRQAYPGVDFRFYGRGQELEYDVIVSPGGDPNQVRFRYDGIKALAVTPSGDLAVTLPRGERYLQKKPVVYQEQEGRRIARDGRFKLYHRKGVWEYGFEVAAYDRTLPLVIDPVIIYSTYLGGTLNDYGLAVAVDDAGNAYITGRTYFTTPPSFPTYPLSTHHGSFDVFVLKMSPKGDVLLFSTLLGGTGSDGGRGIAVSRDGSVWVTGDTSSDTFPTMSPLYPRGGVQDAFIAKLNGTTGALKFSTFMGGAGNDIGRGIAVLSTGDAYMVGESASDNFPLKNQLYSYQGLRDVILVKIKADATAVLYSTYLGGSNDDVGTSVTVDRWDNIVYIAGYTSSINFPVNKNYSNYMGGVDAFICCLEGDNLLYSTYLGGTGNDYAYGIAVDRSRMITRDIMVTGITSSPNFPVKNAIHNYQGGYDAFVTKIHTIAQPVTLLYSTYLGGTGYDTGNAIAVDRRGNAYITGYTNSTAFPRAKPLSWDNMKGPSDAFVVQLNPKGSLAFSTYLGGNSDDLGYGIAVDSANNVFVTGETDGTGFPTKNPFKAYSGAADLFITKLSGFQTPAQTFLNILLFE